MKRAVNPYLPQYEYVPDGEPYVFGDRLYVYGSHDRFGGNQFCLNNYVCWSAPVDNLGNWRFEGEIFDRKKDPACKEETNRLYAPDMVRGKDGRYYLYYSLSGTNVLSVAVSDQPAGTFEFYGHVHYQDGTLYGSREGDELPYDPGLLLDDDGSLYLYTGFCPAGWLAKIMHIDVSAYEGAKVVMLDSDMLTVITSPRCVVPKAELAKGSSFEGHAFFEASSIRKVKGKYYFIYSSELGHELCYATSDYPDKYFTYGGSLISNGDIGYEGREEARALNYTGTNHGSIVQVKDQWFVFYHRQTNGNSFTRQGCAEKLFIDGAGRIAQVEMTSFGLDTEESLPGPGTYPARIAANLMSADGAVKVPFMGLDEKHPFFTQDLEDGNPEACQYIHNLRDRAVAGYKYFDLSKVNGVSAEVRGEAKGSLQFLTGVDLEHAVLCYELPLDLKGNSQNWLSLDEFVKVRDFDKTNEKRALFLKYSGEGYIDIKSFTLL